jgi:predicted nucleic acid-binding protein
MIAVSDTSPICYLILIGEIDILPKLYSQCSVHEITGPLGREAALPR